MKVKDLQSLYIPAPKLNQLHILTQIGANADITQAELAQRCALSVAMVNNYMQELCSSGLLEYRRRSSKTISYYLTPAGKEAVDSIERDLLIELVRLFGDAKRRIREIVQSQARIGLRRVVLYGSDDLAELALHAIETADVNLVGICDDNPSMVGRDWCGREIQNPYQIPSIAPDCVVVASLNRANEICNSLNSLRSRGTRLIRLDVCDGNGDVQGAVSSVGTTDLVPTANQHLVTSSQG